MSQAQQIVPGPPDLKTCDPGILELAKYLRHGRIEKQRACLLGNKTQDLFRGKRFVRAVLSDEYRAARAKNPRLPEIADHEAALRTLAAFPSQRFAFNVVKLDTNEALSKGLKPKSGTPVCLIPPQQRVGDEQYFVWFYNPVPLRVKLYTGGLLIAGVAAALFQLWPMWARRGVYYLSLVCVAFVGVLLSLTVVRLVLFVLSALVGKAFWLFPNLYADVGFFESFRPVAAWSGTNTLPKKPKQKKRKSRPMSDFVAPTPAGGAGAAAAAAVNAGPAGPAGPAPGAPVPVPGVPGFAVPPGQQPPPPIVQQAMRQSLARADARLRQIVQTAAPKSPQEFELLKRKLLQEEWAKSQAELAEKLRAVQPKQ